MLVWMCVCMCVCVHVCADVCVMSLYECLCNLVFSVFVLWVWMQVLVSRSFTILQLHGIVGRSLSQPLHTPPPLLPPPYPPPFLTSLTPPGWLIQHPAVCLHSHLLLVAATAADGEAGGSHCRLPEEHHLVAQLSYLLCTESFCWWVRGCCVGLVGLVVRRPPRERKIPGSNPARARIFSGSSNTSDLKIGTPVATLPGAWHYRVSAGTGGPGVSILWLGEVESYEVMWSMYEIRRSWRKPLRSGVSQQGQAAAGRNSGLALSVLYHTTPHKL